MNKWIYEKIKNLGVIYFRCVSRLFYLIPINSKRIVCIAYAGKQYSCSPKYLAEYLINNYSGKFEVIFVLRDQKQICLEGIKVVRFMSWQHFFYFCTAKIIINNSGSERYIPKRKGQYFINTWHGGGAYKRIEQSSIHPFTKTEVKRGIYRSKTTDLILSSCKSFSNLVVPDILYNQSVEIMPSGLPRNDLFFSGRVTEIRNEVCRKLNIDQNAIIVLYAPTFRGEIDSARSLSSNQIDFKDIVKLIVQRTNKNCIILFRAHYAIADSSVTTNYLDVTLYPDVQELLCAADILISDYSSVIWDFSLMKKPCFLYMPDKDYYINKDRGVYTSIEEWPGVICETNEELQRKIEELDYDVYRKKIEEYHKKVGSYETGNACRMVCERIIQICQKK